MKKSSEAGQAILLIVLALGLFLLGAVAFAVDMGNLWWHRQQAQRAADAACLAGAMDLLVYNQTPNPTLAQLNALGGNPKAGASFVCSPTSLASACEYATLNGYDSGSGARLTEGTPGNKVTVSFPKTLSNAVTPTKTMPNPTPVWFMQVNIWDSVQTYFLGMLNAKGAKDVGAVAACGAAQVNAPVPILVLAPTGVGTMTVTGGGTVAIAGGPTQSIQVNSSDPAAVSLTTMTNINLTQAGPTANGADFGVWGGPVPSPSSPHPLSCGTGDPWPSCWKPNDPPMADPFAGVPAPVKGIAITTTPTVAAGVDGCAPLKGQTTCDEYAPGYYAKGIQVKSRSAIFIPGVYYIDYALPIKGFSVDALSCVRPSTKVGDGSYGTIFYFTNGATLGLQSGSQSACTTNFPVRSGGLSGLGVFCPGTDMTKIPTPLKTALDIPGNVFLAPCTKGSLGTNVYGGDTIFNDATQRGMLFFEDHLSTASTPGCMPLGCSNTLAGGGTYAAAGSIYFHAVDYKDNFTLNGGTGGGNFAYGSIVTDNLRVVGSGQIGMYLGPGVTSGVLKTTLIQ